MDGNYARRAGFSFGRGAGFNRICMKNMNNFFIRERAVGADAPPLIIAEVGQAHDGSLGTAHAFIDAIADAGADAVKFQTHIAAAESTPAEQWRVRFSYQDDTRYDYWRRMEFSAEQWQGLKRHADERNLIFLSSPFSPEAVELLTRVGVPAWKIASGETGNLPLLAGIAATGLPVLLSSGMSPLAETDLAVQLLREHGVGVGVFQCSSFYPCPPEKTGLNMLGLFAERYQCPVGLSDHSGTIYPCLAATALGAHLLEVHVTLSRRMFGPDVPASITIEDLAALVEGARHIHTALRHPVNKDGLASELAPMRSLFTKSIVAARDLRRGAVLTAGDVKVKKPGTGLRPERLPELLGCCLKKDVKEDQLLGDDDVEWRRS